MRSITVKELRGATSEHVRRAGGASTPVVVTDRGRPVAVLANPALLQPRRRVRRLLPEFAALMVRQSGSDLASDFESVRCER